MKKVFLTYSLVIMAVIFSSCTNTKKQAEDTTDNNATEMTNEEWITLFDGESFEGWRGYGRTDMPSAWTIEDGAIKIRPLQLLIEHRRQQQRANDRHRHIENHKGKGAPQRPPEEIIIGERALIVVQPQPIGAANDLVIGKAVIEGRHNWPYPKYDQTNNPRHRKDITPDCTLGLEFGLGAK